MLNAEQQQQELQALKNLARELKREAGAGNIAVESINRAKAHLAVVSLRITELEALAAE